ncbi:sensor histidine kinase [Clostridium sp. 2-1]|uniref:sensor histidine kinase n=1 Tax=Clostridium TaxID=1485 RepID=UPI0003FC4CE9|nr:MULTISPECIES: HAMP domain-containing sensor histidine kinase [Clostridium]MBN7575533.1 HAMP domain-containing histidine kinase [Clostridium beijerinckii]MBN7580844.1 HAMP domain-containing histidine kinase [Clostridium beijerinckii]MBN7585297.1 HAMP domain-containing histidine kinase [Clostridium beijerinckii]MBO0521131.1 HAMP domain-containing histidine kinase [Clostridium beijerinckii]POO91513.1 sensor histidine kinase [Clostridium sp. 2-1]
MKNSIQSKILISFSIIIYIGLSILLFASYKLTEQNDNNIVYADMIEAKKNMDQYLRQYFLINNIDFNEASIIANANDISVQLSSIVGDNAEIYNLNGNEISHNSEKNNIENDNNKDLTDAMNGKISYVTTFYGDKAKVSLSYPIEVDENYIGILRYTKDYTQLFNSTKRFRYVINILVIVIFSMVFIAAAIISRRITKPIKKLEEITEEISNGNFDINIDVNSDDEIGDLAKRFKMMVKKIEEQIEIIRGDRDMLKELQAQNKIFFDNVTHELKTPITVIMGYAQAIQDNEITNKKLFDKSIAYIFNESKRLNNMVVELLELSKTSSTNFSYHFENVDISELIRMTTDEMKIKGKKYNINICCSVMDNLLLKGDRERLKEVLINLIDNSIKYGKVNSKVEVSAYKESNTILIRVKDEGEGISEENIEKLFEPFYRASKKISRELGSAGLGLTIVKSIIEKHGGNIEVKSKINEGTEVIIRFEEHELC